MKKTIIVTGAAGFIGFHITKKLLNNGERVIGFDNLNDYYDTNLKKSRLRSLTKNLVDKKKFDFIKGNLEDKELLNSIFAEYKPKIIIHLAAQAGVRNSLQNPHSYVNSNLVGFSNILEMSRIYSITNLIYASSSSVYGGNEKIPFCESDPVNHPVSLYAATKKANELMAHSYSHLYDIPATGLRLFTVYGPWGRPDMSPMIFAKAILEGEPIRIFNDGKMSRDFTFIDDITEIIFRLIEKPATNNPNFDFKNPDPSSSWCKHMIFNVGNSKKIELMTFINEIENSLGLEAKKIFMPIQNGDVKETFSNSNNIEKWINFKPNTSIKYGINKFISWYKDFYSY